MKIEIKPYPGAKGYHYAHVDHGPPTAFAKAVKAWISGGYIERFQLAAVNAKGQLIGLLYDPWSKWDKVVPVK